MNHGVPVMVQKVGQHWRCPQPMYPIIYSIHIGKGCLRNQLNNFQVFEQYFHFLEQCCAAVNNLPLFPSLRLLVTLRKSYPTSLSFCQHTVTIFQFKHILPIIASSQTWCNSDYSVLQPFCFYTYTCDKISNNE